MSLSKALAARSQECCELCKSTDSLSTYIVPPTAGLDVSEQLAVCATCADQLASMKDLDVNHWRCLNDSVWSEVPAVQVVSYRLLKALPNESWAQDLINMMYMEDETRTWAESVDATDGIIHVDSNGHQLADGDTVVLIKDLNVKGANFTAKRGTAVRRIRLDKSNAEHIEGRVDGQHIVILTKYVKKKA